MKQAAKQQLVGPGHGTLGLIVDARRIGRLLFIRVRVGVVTLPSNTDLDAQLGSSDFTIKL